MKAQRPSVTCDQLKRIMGLFLAGLCTMTAKAAMLLVVLGHFRLLRGLVRLPGGDWANSLSDGARLSLWADTRRQAVRLNLIVGTATGVWMFAQGLALGLTAWTYLLSLGLLTLLLTQGIILHGQRIPSAGVNSPFRALAALLLSTLRQLTLAYGRTVACAALIFIVCPVLANSIGATISILAGP